MESEENEVKSKIALCVTMLLLCACGAEPAAQRAKNLNKYIEYGVDSRTNLCFAVSSANAYGPIGTHVPCTAEVKRLAGVIDLAAVPNPNEEH